MEGVTQLGYLGLGVSNLETWARFATQVLGLEIKSRHARPLSRLRARRRDRRPALLDRGHRPSRLQWAPRNRDLSPDGEMAKE